MGTERWTRRELLERSMFAAAAAAAGPRWSLAAGGRSAGPNETLRVAIVGVKGRGKEHLNGFLRMKDVEVAALVDVDPRVSVDSMKLVEQKTGKAPVFHKDLRKALEDKSLDAVSIATTDHTHALLTVWALQAGKHVYIEKPVTHNIFEGRKMMEAARKYKRICQAGHQCRSSRGLQEAMAFLHKGELGKVQIARGLCYKRRGSIGKKADTTPPEGVDYDLWLGPAPVRPFNPNRFHYNWHWFWDYGASDMTAQGVHQMDIARWGLNKKELALRVACAGGRFGYEDDGEVPNTQVAWFDYGDCELVFETRGLDTPPYKDARIGVIFHCEKGYVVNPTYTSATVFDPDGKKIRSFGGGDGDHFRNFVDAIRSGKPSDLTCEIEEGHLSASLCHMAQISWRLGEKKPLTVDAPFGDLKTANEAFSRMKEHLVAEKVDLASAPNRIGPVLSFDPKAERFTGNDAANRDLLMKREYRKPFVVPESLAAL